MKSRDGFVSNSSSTSFIITNISKTEKTLVDFVKENPQLVEQFKNKYDVNDADITQETLLKESAERDIFFLPGKGRTCVFGDEQHDVIGRGFDYILRDGGKSKSFTWSFDTCLR